MVILNQDCPPQGQILVELDVTPGLGEGSRLYVGAQCINLKRLILNTKHPRRFLPEGNIGCVTTCRNIGC